VSSPALQKIQHYGFLSRRSKIDLDDVRSDSRFTERRRAGSGTRRLACADAAPCGNAASDADGPRCPNCGGRLIFERFHRIRPPPLTHESRQPGTRSSTIATPEDIRQRRVTRF
jgi:hypothetical protein